LAEFILGRGSILPPHAHPYEQIGYRVEGRLRIGGEEFAVRAGDAWRIPADDERGDQVF
jgi:quercetin dioxygenase-like cupin family protein